MTDTAIRATEYPIDAVFTRRWSPRAFDGSALAEADILPLFEAARWAPSAYNMQPWRFLYALRGDAHWDAFLDVLVPFNRGWAQSASALIFILSDGKVRDTDGSAKGDSYSHSFDAGAAWAMLALQATLNGLHVHGMTGIEMDKAAAALAVPDGFRIEAAVAVGRIGDPEALPEGLREREMPSPRKTVAEIAFAGPFPAGG